MRLTRSPSHALLIVAFSLAQSLTLVAGLSFSIAGKSRRGSSLRRDEDVTSIFLTGAADVIYSANITLGGKAFEVDIDTGSSDLWVKGDVPGSGNTTVPLALAYGIGAVGGFISLAEVTFDDHKIVDQAYLNVIKELNISSTSDGILGLGPSKSSLIRQTLNTSAGDPFLDRVFMQNMSAPNILTVLLSRLEENSTTTNTEVSLLQQQYGELTIGDVVESYEDVNKQPKLPVVVDSSGTNQHWMTLLDSNGILGPDGQKINTKTSVQNSTGKKDQITVVFDSGFTFPQVPAYISDSFYGRVPGAYFDNSSNFWVVPCDYELNATFTFSGVDYPIPPLDMTYFGGSDDSANDVCVGWFQPIASNLLDQQNEFGSFDVILGTAFLRNAYLLINFGDFVDGSSASVADPFIQLLSTADKEKAHKDFVTARLGGKDTTGSQAALLPVSQMKSSATNSTSKAISNLEAEGSDDKDDEPVYKKTWFIVVVAVGGAAVLALIAGIVFALSRRRRSKVRSEGAFVPPVGSYKPLIMKDDASDSRPLGHSYKDSVTGYQDSEARLPLGQFKDSETGYHDPYSDEDHTRGSHSENH